MTIDANWSDAEARSDYLHDRPEPDHPTRAEAEADAAHDVRPNTDRRPCAGAWGVSHGTPAEMAACIDCNTPFAPRCRWVDDVCQHGARIDDRETQWNPETRRFICATRERRLA